MKLKNIFASFDTRDNWGPITVARGDLGLQLSGPLPCLSPLGRFRGEVVYRRT